VLEEWKKYLATGQEETIYVEDASPLPTLKELFHNPLIKKIGLLGILSVGTIFLLTH
jgi:hypothetical protein